MIYFIVNPAAGSGRAKEAVPIIRQIMQENSVEHSFIYTDGPDDSTRISGLIGLDESAKSVNAQAIVCVGGDGTVQEYVGLVVNKGVKFGIIPCGSGNDLLCSLAANCHALRQKGSAGDGAKKFPSFAEKIIFFAKKIIRGETIDVDAVMVNGQRYFINIGGAGIDIQVLQDALPLKKVFGGAAYFLSLVKNAITYNTVEMTLTVDGVSSTDKYLLLAVCNGAFYGGNLRIAPPAFIDDGLITLCVVKKMPRLKLMALFPAVKPGRHIGFKEVSFINCSEAVLEFEDKKLINLDGNLLEYTSPLTFEIIKAAVKLIV